MQTAPATKALQVLLIVLTSVIACPSLVFAGSGIDNNRFTFTGDPNWMPFEAFDDQGNYIGMVSDVLKAVSKETGLDIDYVKSDSWSHALELAGSLQADVISGDIFDHKIMQTHRFTSPYLENSLVLLGTRETQEVQEIRAVGDKRIGIIKGYGYTWELKQAYRDIDFIEVEHIQAGLLDLSSNKLDYLVSSEILGRYQINQLDLHNLHVVGRLPVSIKVGLAVSKLKPELYQEIETAIRDFRPGRIDKIVLTWTDPNSRWILREHIYRAAWGLAAVLLLLSVWLYLNWLQRHRMESMKDRLTEAMLASNAGIWTWHAKDDSYYFSPRFFARYGHEAEQVPSNENEWLYLLFKDDVAHYLENGIRAKPPEKNSPTPFELRLRICDDQEQPHWVRMRGNVTSWKNNQPIEAMGTLEDISHIVAAEGILEKTRLQLQDREALLSSLFDNLPDMIWFKDLEGRYIDCNLAYSDMLGQSKNALIGHTDLDLNLDDDASLYDSEDRRAYISREILEFERWIDHASNSERRRLNIRKIPIEGSDDSQKGVLCIARDATERHKLTGEFLRFRRFAEQSRQGFGIADPKGNLVYMNPKLCEMLGVHNEPEEWRKRALSSFYPESVATTMTETVMPALAQQGYWDGELAVLMNGTALPTQQTFFQLLDDDGNAEFSGIIITDISRQKADEAELASARDEAENANATKSVFLANMSHEIRTPLNAIVGYSKLLAQYPDLDPAVHTRLRAMMAAGERLLGLINDILDLSKIEAGYLRLNERPFNLYQEITTTLSILQGRADSKAVRLRLDNKLDRTDTVYSDSVKFSQIFMNIVANAIKFTDQGEVQIIIERDNNNIQIEVRDTGRGIAPDLQEKLFNPFIQGADTAHGGGTGLGLSLSKKLANLFNGDITLTSEEGVGTQVIISLYLPPIPDSTVQTPPPPTSPQFKLNKSLRVLVAEDDVWSRDLLCFMLRDIGCEVIEAENGADALSLMLEGGYDLYLTDNRMPKLDGVEVLQALRKKKPADSTPIIAVTASILDHQRQSLLQAGFDRVIGKPYRIEELYDIITAYTTVGLVDKSPEDINGSIFKNLRSDPRKPSSGELDEGQLKAILHFSAQGNLTELQQITHTWLNHQEASPTQKALHKAIKQLDMLLVESLAETALQELQLESQKLQ